MPQRIITANPLISSHGVDCSCYTKSMDWNAQLARLLVARVMCGCWILISASLLSACSFMDPQSQHIAFVPHDDLSTLPDGTYGVQQGLPMDDYLPDQEKKEKVKLGLSQAEARALGCTVGDRFDGGAALAYNFKDEQSRLALHLGIDGPSFSDPGNFEVNKVMIRYTYQFQKPSKTQKARCLYPSGFQGVLGSTYNEFFVRKNYPIWRELRDMGINLK